MLIESAAVISGAEIVAGDQRHRLDCRALRRSQDLWERAGGVCCIAGGFAEDCARKNRGARRAKRFGKKHAAQSARRDRSAHGGGCRHRRHRSSSAQRGRVGALPPTPARICLSIFLSFAESQHFRQYRRSVGTGPGAQAERRRDIDALLERLGLAVKRNRYPDELSGGQQQRAALRER